MLFELKKEESITIFHQLLVARRATQGSTRMPHNSSPKLKQSSLLLIEHKGEECITIFYKQQVARCVTQCSDTIL